MKTRNITIIALLAAALASSGCVLRTYQEGDTKYTSFSFGTSQGVAPFSLEAGRKDSDSYRKLESKGLTNDPQGAAIEAAVTAAIKATR